MVSPIKKGSNGSAQLVDGYVRGEGGKFGKGNKGGPGNPYAKRLNELRKSLYAAISTNDVQEILAAMIEGAKKGDVQAAKLVLGYVVQQPTMLEGNEDDATISVVARIPRNQAMDLMATSKQLE